MIYWLILLSIFISCNVNQKAYILPELTINGKMKNNLIVRRIPDYGDGHRDGCIVWGEMQINITKQNDTIFGRVLDIKKQIPPPIMIEILQVNKLNKIVMKSTADSSGNFRTILSSEMYELLVTSLSYRDLRFRLKN
jgi:hypothetical protein